MVYFKLNITVFAKKCSVPQNGNKDSYNIKSDTTNNDDDITVIRHGNQYYYDYDNDDDNDNDDTLNNVIR